MTVCWDGDSCLEATDTNEGWCNGTGRKTCVLAAPPSPPTPHPSPMPPSPSPESPAPSLMMKIARGNVANTAALDASGHPAPLRWLASKDALLHPDADERMTIPALIEHCAIESLARASAREVGSGGRGGGSIMSAVV